ncbi:regulatory protein MarR [Thermobifida fusca TM51]|uniref:Regulatory protein MarR n=1 Tax=Thermobifida fusca TM51 TaxID=1169414 RepID=A0A9P2WRN8_THEFU|nr:MULTISPECIES: MarR family transcriptional regulator [Thermobifida]EOR72031.1 regulatory protein MarR [Thermobifida fusca TM51]MBO2529228.1 MarR family transcriptional regulator [Thermobifida sp.]MDD6790958.1 MarR family transcriptional regulator [Thermobifida fusca]PPS90180.1 MarR family transcriptional regulator [Thermobifida fusca]PZN60931.1 MAG: MarR family transcriptional regulator [Thermobifida fusca]
MNSSDSSLGDPLALENQVCFALTIAARNVVALYRPVLAPLGLTHPQYLVMLALWQYAPVSVKELATLLELDSATLSPLLKRLEAAGLVRRERNPDDERRLMVTLTPAGREMQEKARDIPERMMRLLGMDPEELRHLNAVLSRLNAAATSADLTDAES